MEQVALIEYSSWRPFHGNLVWGGSWGVYFYGTYDCVGDCGMVWEFDTPVQYPP